MNQSSTSLVRRLMILCGFLPVLLLAQPAAALLPPLVDWVYDDGEVAEPIKAPEGWQVAAVKQGVRMQRDATSRLLGAVELGFYHYDEAALPDNPVPAVEGRAPTPDQFMTGALRHWSTAFTDWRVIETVAPRERPRVRLATVSFRLHGFACRGYAMAVIGEHTGTLGFAYAETVTAKTLQLDQLVGLVVAGSYSYHTPRDASGAKDQAINQTIANLYGTAKNDFRQLWTEYDQKNQLDLALLPLCSSYQPVLRNLKGFLQPHLTQRQQGRVAELEVYCLPTQQFNAFALGRNPLGPGFLAFHARLTMAFANVARQYASLREDGADPERLSAELTAYTTAVAQAILTERPLPEPRALNLANQAVANRYTKVFNSMIALIMAHEMGHYYLRHSESGQTNDPFSIQQRELAADQAAISHLQAVADATSDVWEGGVIHAFGLLATIDTVADQAGDGQQRPEWTRSHPMGKTRLDLALAQLGGDNLQFRHDPWNGGTALEHGSGGIRVVGGLTRRDGQPQAAFTHPVSGVAFSFPAGWQARWDEAEKLLTLHRAESPGGFPVAMYAAGDQQTQPDAVVKEILKSFEATAEAVKELRSEAFDPGLPGLRGHLAMVELTSAGERLVALAVGLISSGQVKAHGLLLLTVPGNRERDLESFQTILAGMQFP